MSKVHKSRVGTYHSAPCYDCACERAECSNPGEPVPHCVCFHNEPCNGVAWTVQDTYGYSDIGPECEQCGACDCTNAPLSCCGHVAHEAPDDCACCEEHDPDCIGLSFAFVCLDGGDTLCEHCAQREGIEIVPCDCEEEIRGITSNNYEEDKAAFPASAYRVNGWGRGIAFYVLGWETEPDETTEYSGYEQRTDRVIVCMIGDNRHFTVNLEDITPLMREEYCGVCGQVGCTHDGLER